MNNDKEWELADKFLDANSPEKTYTKSEVIDFIKWVHQEISHINTDTTKWVLPDNRRVNSEGLFNEYFIKTNKL